MKPQKLSKKQIELVDLGSKKIQKYPLDTKLMSVAYMVVDGRHPKGKKKFLLEHDCAFVVYLIKGKGKVYAGDEVFDVRVGDVVFVPTEHRFAVEGKMEYVTVDTPAFYLEQSEEVTV